jgi:hypothetical protein
MKRCADCGFDHDDNARTCWHCGGRDLRALQASELPEALGRSRVVEAALQSSRIEHKRQLRSVIAGIAGGGTLVVVLISLLLHDWSFLSRWLGGLGAIAVAVLLVAVKRWLGRGAARLADQMIDESSEIRKPDA